MTKNNDGFEPGQALTFPELQAMRNSKPKSAVPDRDDIDRMPKAEVKEWLEAHGVEDAKGRIDEMREQLKAAMFI